MSNGQDKYVNEGGRRALAAVEVLAERPLASIDPDRLAERLGCQRDGAFRALKTLEAAGWAEPAPDGKGWRISPHASRLSERVRLAVADLHRAYLGDMT